MEFFEELAQFCAKTRDWPETYDGLILVGTGQPITGALLIARFAPKWVEYLLTEQMRHYPLDVEEKLGHSVPGREPVRLADSSPSAIYMALKEVRRRNSDLLQQRVAVDVTGGKKPMGIGLAKAAYVLGLDTVYVDSTYIAGERVEGSQQLEEMPEPYQLFGDIQSAEAERLWWSHDYAGAARIYDGLGKLPNLSASDCDRYLALANLAAAYAAWDSFDLGTAQTALHTLLDKPLPPDLTAWQQTLTKQERGLARLTAQAVDPNNLQEVELQIAGDLTVLGEVALVLPLLGSLYMNGLRRVAIEIMATTETKKTARYDMAAMLLYRCLELLAQHQLAKNELSTIAPDYAKAARKCAMDLLQLRSSYAKVADAQTLARQKRGWTQAVGGSLPGARFGLFAGYMVLAALVL